MKKNKQEVITFKADESLLKAMQGIPNRSEFIRGAILSALDQVCPFCKGSGTLSGEQREDLERTVHSYSLAHEEVRLTAAK